MVTARCFDGSRVSTSIRPAERIADLKKAFERLTGIHRTTQRLVFAGSSLADEATVGSALVDGATLFTLQLKRFPATLGPFKVESTPFHTKDFELPPLDDDFVDQGSMWLMSQRSTTRHGVKGGRGIEFPLCGQFSPPHQVTLTDAEKAALSIPTAASSFVFSYPVVDVARLDGGADVARSFLSIGGYVYLDSSRRVIHTNTLLPTEKESGGLQFASAQAWRSEWTTALMRQGRFQRITIADLNELGAHHFCWLRPGEEIKGEDGQLCQQQPDVPHGGFAYLFHRDVFNATPEDSALDRYFAIVSGEEYVAPEGEGVDAAEEGESGRAMFTLVSNLQLLQDFVEEQDAAPTHDGGQQLQARIVTLERQLDSVTRCVACLVEEKSTILEPCSHLCMCTACAQRITHCPICRTAIIARKRAFQS